MLRDESDTNPLLEEQFHCRRARAERLSENLLYYFFSVRENHAQSPCDIWRSQCPCPYGPRCPHARNCSFDRRAAKDFSFAADPRKEQDASRLFSTMQLLFCRRSRPSAVTEPDDEACAEVWRTFCPAPEPPLSLALYNEHPYDFIQALGLPLRAMSCKRLRREQACTSWQCQREGLAHSLDEMMEPFKDARVRGYFLYWIENAAKQGLYINRLPQMPLRVTTDKDEWVRCRCCHERHNLKLQLAVAHPVNGCMPCCAILCNRCYRKTVISVYRC